MNNSAVLNNVIEYSVYRAEGGADVDTRIIVIQQKLAGGGIVIHDYSYTTAAVGSCWQSAGCVHYLRQSYHSDQTAYYGYSCIHASPQRAGSSLLGPVYGYPGG